jgi:hypothetical protein
VLAVAVATAQVPKPSPPPPPPDAPTSLRQLQIANKPWLGDFDKLLQRRMLRGYAPFSRSLYFSDKGRERGLAVELVRDWERYLNIKYAKELGKRPLTVYVLPGTRDQLLPFLKDGLADVTLKQGVVREIQARVPTITRVLDVTDHAGGTNPYYQPGKGGTSAI